MASIKSTGKLKKEALESLKGNWGKAVLVAFVVALLTQGLSYTANISRIKDFVFNAEYYFSNADAINNIGQEATALSGLGNLINLLIGGSIAYGLSYFFINIIKRSNPQCENLFSGFKFFGKNFLVQLVKTLLSFLWGIVVGIPAFIIIMIITLGSLGSLRDMSYSLGIANIILIGLIVLIWSVVNYIITARYEMVYFIAIDKPELSATECIKSSVEMMKGHCVRYFLLNLTFIGWDILVVFTLGIGSLWLNPYKYATRANFYLDLKGEDHIVNDDEPKEKIDMYKEV